MSGLSTNRYAVLAPNGNASLATDRSEKSAKQKKKKAKATDSQPTHQPSLPPPGATSKTTGMLERSGGTASEQLGGLRTRAPLLSDYEDLLEKGREVDVVVSSKNANSHQNPSAAKSSKSRSKPPKQRHDQLAKPTSGAAPGALTFKDRQAMVLLVILYMLQGIPVGLAFGSVPFLLRARLSYSQIGLFSLASYPYSLKLLWSPIVDSWYLTKIGRRRSWIIPVQALVGMMLYWLGSNVDALMDADVPDVKTLTALFFTLVMFAATQDIAVDGWALELLSQDNLSYASTAQTVGLNIGYFLSFTVFLAFNSLEFSNNRWRALFGLSSQVYPIMTLSGYLKFGGLCFIIVTVYLALIQSEDPVKSSSGEAEMGIKGVYQVMSRICQLKHVQSFILLHLIVKLGTSVNDAATSLKLLERGLSKEDMALSVLIDFPFQIFLGYFAAKWSSGEKPLRPWIWAMWFRLAFSAWNVGLVYFFPDAMPLPNSYFILVIVSTVLSSFASTVQFVGISAFHTQIADPVIGGTYMTLLNTVSNLGGTWPKYFVLKGVDYFTQSTCSTLNSKGERVFMDGFDCTSDVGKAKCSELLGACHTIKDGYYFMQAICIATGALILLFVVQPVCHKLQSLPSKAWHVTNVGKS